MILDHIRGHSVMIMNKETSMCGACVRATLDKEHGCWTIELGGDEVYQDG